MCVCVPLARLVLFTDSPRLKLCISLSVADNIPRHQEEEEEEEESIKQKH